MIRVSRFGFGCFCLLCFSSAHAAVWYVDINAPAGGNGTSWQTAFKTIQPAIDAASANDEIWVTEGLYNEPRSGNGAIILKDNLSLYGGFIGTESNRDDRTPQTHPTIIDGYTAQAGNPAENNVEMGNNTILDGFEIRGAIHNGILLQERNIATVRACAIHHNGRGIEGGELTVVNCRFENNSGEIDGGAILSQWEAELRECIFINNSATSSGGAFFSAYHPFLIDKCSFINNYAPTGSAIYVRGMGGNGVIDGCRFTNHTGSEVIYHDWIYWQEKSLSGHVIANCIFHNNSATDINCAMSPEQTYVCSTYCWPNEEGEGELICEDYYCGEWPISPSILNCTFIGNQSPDRYAIFSLYDWGYLYNCVLYNCSVEKCNVYYSLSYPQAIPSTLNVDPLFMDTANCDFRLRSDSPCIDTGGEHWGEIMDDFLGTLRPVDGDGLGAGTTGDGSDYDIGAFEYTTALDPVPPVITLIGSEHIQQECNMPYTDDGALAQDNIDGDITQNIIAIGTVEPETPGDYPLVFTVYDSSGNPATVTRTVTIQDTTPPGITLFGANPLILSCTNTYTEPGARASDTCDTALYTVDIDPGALNTNLPGSYSVTYTVSDASGNPATVTRTVIVEPPCTHPNHNADQNSDFQISLSELLRVVQLFNSVVFHCETGTEDGYAPGPGDTSCPAHGSDYHPADWRINLSEVLRLIQIYNSPGYRYCPDEGSEDGFCPNVGD